MEIKEIIYEELVNTGNYENIKLGMIATVSKEEDVDMAVSRLTKKVRRNLKEIVNGGGKVHG